MSDANKIVPIRGVHETVYSLLAEVMNDPAVKRCVVFTFDGKGDMGYAHIKCTNSDLSYVSVVAADIALGGS